MTRQREVQEDDAASGMEKLAKKQMSEIGYEIVVTRGDYRGEQ